MLCNKIISNKYIVSFHFIFLIYFNNVYNAGNILIYFNNVYNAGNINKDSVWASRFSVVMFVAFALIGVG